MKKIIISLALCLSALAVSARDYSHPVGYYKLQSNHSISTTLLGLEYSYEGRVADRWTLIGRAGLVPVGFTLYSNPYAGVMLISGPSTPVLARRRREMKSEELLYVLLPISVLLLMLE